MKPRATELPTHYRPSLRTVDTRTEKATCPEQGFPERELPRFRKEASILRTEDKTTHSRKGALATCLSGETCVRNIADIFYTASGLRAVTQHPSECATHIFPKQEFKFSPPENMFLSSFLAGWSDRAMRWVEARFWRWLTASGRPDPSHRLAPML